MIYEKSLIEAEINKYLPTFPNHNNSKLAEIMQSTGSLGFMSHRQLRHYIGELREAKKSLKTGNKLVIGDLHEPFSLDEYFDFCKGLYKKYDCDSVMFIGDILDSSYSSYHETDPDGLSAGDELYFAKKRLKRWFDEYPVADCMLGNHDLIIQRKAKSAGLSKHVLKPFNEIVEAPSTWNFHYEDYQIGNVLYSHGNIGNAFTKALQNRMSVVQGHTHSQAFIQYSVSIKDSIYGFNVGCGIDHHKYAFAYGKPFPKKPIISAGVVLDNGKLPILELMNL